MTKDHNDNVSATKQEIRRKYDKFASRYDLLNGVTELLGVSRLRRRFLKSARGNVLEVAVGTGKNFKYYPQPHQITGTDLSRAMLRIARKRADRLGLTVAFLVMDGEFASFPDQTFDTVVSSLSLCTFADPVTALREMARVCRADGRILLFEHGRSDREQLGRWQDRKADRHAKNIGCHWNREPLDLLSQAGLTLINGSRYFFGVFHLIEAAPLSQVT